MRDRVVIKAILGGYSNKEKKNRMDTMKKCP